MIEQRRTFETVGPIAPEKNYFVSRHEEIDSFKNQIMRGRYIVIFAPRQTGKTTFFRKALDELAAEDSSYIPIMLNFEIYPDVEPTRFYEDLHYELVDKISAKLKKLDVGNFDRISRFMAAHQLKDALSLRRFFQGLPRELPEKKIVLVIDEFDGIAQDALRGFLHSLRYIYLSEEKCLTVGIVGVRSVTQLGYDRSISPFNIQDEFHLPNFTEAQIAELYQQYTNEVGQLFEPEVISSVYEKTVGQPYLVNRLAQILTAELGILKDENIRQEHFEEALARLLKERNVHFQHIITNIKRRPLFEKILMRIVFDDKGVPFNLSNDDISELVTYGVVGEGKEGYCVIENPIYQKIIFNAFSPLFNNVEEEYFSEKVRGFSDFLTASGKIDMQALIENFCDFIKRAGFRILEVPDTPQEFVGQYLLRGYLDTFVRQIKASIHLEVPTGRGRMDLIIFYKGQKYIVETKLWSGEEAYQRGKKQLTDYLKLEQTEKGYYVVFDHRTRGAIARREKDILDEKTIYSYCIPVIQKRPTDS